VGLVKQVKGYLRPEATVIASVPRYAAMKDSAHARDYTELEFKELMSNFGNIEMLSPIGPWMLCRCSI